jgi:hypothetical protein
MEDVGFRRRSAPALCYAACIDGCHHQAAPAPRAASHTASPMNPDHSAAGRRTSQTGTEPAEFHVLVPDGLASFASEATSIATPVGVEDVGNLLLQFPEEGSRLSAEDFHAPPLTRAASSRRMATAGLAFAVVAAAAGGWWMARQRVINIAAGPVTTIAQQQNPIAHVRPAAQQVDSAPEADTPTRQPARDIAQVEPTRAVASPAEAVAAVSPPRPQNTTVVAAAVPSMTPRPRPSTDAPPSRGRANTLQLGTSGARTTEPTPPTRSRPPIEPTQTEVKPPAPAVTPPATRFMEQPAVLRAPETTVAAAIVPAAALPVEDAPSAPQAAVPAPPPPQPQAFATVATRSEQSEIQQTLGQYRTAYQRLDAQAARTVWPSVDARALGRAFSSLTSQQLAFDSCVFDITGNNATAHCTGSASYTPKVGGGGPRSELRQWTFRLQKAPDGWKIQSAQIRRDN